MKTQQTNKTTVTSLQDWFKENETYLYQVEKSLLNKAMKVLENNLLQLNIEWYPNGTTYALTITAVTDYHGYQYYKGFFDKLGMVKMADEIVSLVARVNDFAPLLDFDSEVKTKKDKEFLKKMYSRDFVGKFGKWSNLQIIPMKESRFIPFVREVGKGNLSFLDFNFYSPDYVLVAFVKTSK